MKNNSKKISKKRTDEAFVLQNEEGRVALIKSLRKSNGNIIRSEEEKNIMKESAAYFYGKFLNSLGFDWEADSQTKETPMRVVKAWIDDLAFGSMNEQPKIKAFPNDEKYTGLVCQTKIPVRSMCAHHNIPFMGVAHVAYIPGKKKKDLVIGLSKLNRITEWYSQRPQIQESLTKQIHSFVDKMCVGNRGVAVVIEAQHLCVASRGVKHDSIMKTSEMSGYFFSNEIGTRQEFFNLIDQSRS